MSYLSVLLNKPHILWLGISEKKTCLLSINIGTILKMFYNTRRDFYSCIKQNSIIFILINLLLVVWQPIISDIECMKYVSWIIDQSKRMSEKHDQSQNQNLVMEIFLCDQKLLNDVPYYLTTTYAT